MAEAKGSSSGGAAGGGDFMGGGVAPPHGYQALLASVSAMPTGPNVHHQYNSPGAGLIRHPAAMPAPVTVSAMPCAVRTPHPQLCAQSTNVPQGGYQYWAAAATGASQTDPAVAAAQQVPRGAYADLAKYDSTYLSGSCGSSSNNTINGSLAKYNSTYISGSCGSTSSNNGYQHQLAGLIRPCSTTTWTNYMMSTNPNFYGACTTTPAVLNQHQTSYQANGHEKNPGFASSFSIDPPLVSSPCFPPISPVSNNDTSLQFFNEATFTGQKVKNSEDPPDIESENSDELVDHTPAAADLLNLNQGREILTARFNCRGYRIVVRKDLTNSDVGNIGRIVMPKRDAEANLPALLERDGMILKMDDFKLPVTWNFKYRFWPNNKSRMYILESTGEFVKSHGLQAGDTLVIYKIPESHKFLVRGEKAGRQNVPLLCPECKEVNGVEECGFAVTVNSKKT